MKLSIKSVTKLIALTVLMLPFSVRVFAQKEVEVTMEDIKEKCKDLPPEKRTTVRVSRFNVTTPHSTSEFGANMATMLTNALQGVNCFTVLEMLSNLDDSKKEIEFGKSGNTSGKSSPKGGKMRGAQVVFTGEVTEYNHSTKSVGVAMVSKKTEVLELGFIIKILNPETGTVIDSKSFNVKGEESGSTRVHIGYADFSNSGKSSPAEADALEKGIIKAVDYLTNRKNKIRNALASDAAAAVAEGITTNISISNSKFTTLNIFAETLKGDAKIKGVEKSFLNGICTFVVDHTGTSDELLEYITSKTGTKYEVTGFATGQITLKAK